MTRKRWVTLGLLTCLFFFVAGTASGSSVYPRIDWWVLSSGGAPASGGNTGLNATLGQTAIGLSSGGNVNLSSGYWFGPAVIYQDDFSGATKSEWSSCATRQDTTPSGRAFLGQFGNETACLVFSNLPFHTSIKVVFDLYIIRTWNGNRINETQPQPGTTASVLLEPGADVIGPDQWKFAVDGAEFVYTTFSNWPGHDQAYPGSYPTDSYPATNGAFEVNTLGYQFVGLPMDTVYRFTYNLPHTADTLRLDFTGLGLQAIDNESWGLDNVYVALDPPQVQLGAFKVFLPAILR